MTGIDKTFVTTYINLKKDGLAQDELSQLKKMAESGQVDPEAAKALYTEISKDGKIDADEQKLLQVIGQAAKDQSTAQKFETSIDPANKEISKLIQLGFKEKTSVQNFVPALNVSSMDASDKITEAMERSFKYLPGDVQEKVKALFTKENMAILGTVLAGYAASHAVGIGEGADVVLGTAGYVAMGSEIIDVAKNLYHFAEGAIDAKTEQELEQAAQQLAKGASTVLVDLAAVMVTKKVMQETGGIKININPPGNLAVAGMEGMAPLSVGPAISITRIPVAVSIGTAGAVLSPALLMRAHAQPGFSGGKEYSYKNGVYEDASYHSSKTNSVKSKRPVDGQAALDNSVPVKETTNRRVGVSNGEIVVIDETSPGKFHGHVRSWDELTQLMRNALVKGGLVKANGKIITK